MHILRGRYRVRCARSCLPLVFIGRAPMLNDTTKPGEVLHKGGLDLLTLLHRRDVELHAHLTLWCSNDDQQRCEHFDHGFITRPSSPRLPFRGGPHDRQNIGRRRQIASSARREIPATPAFVVAGFPAPLYERENRGAATPTVATASCSCVERKTPPRRGSSWRGFRPRCHPSGRKFWGHRGNACRR
jgi:hypothetical protein